MANYILNFDNAYADCLNVTLINFKANADCIEYAFSITQITLNISKVSYLIHIASSNIRICTQSDLSAYSNSFDIAITQGTLNIGGAELSISFTALIIQAYSYCISIINSKALSIAIIIRLSIDFSGSIVWLYIDRESLFTGTYFIAIYCRHSLDFIIGYFKTFSNAIFNFDSYGASVGLVLIILRLLMMVVLIALKTVLLNFRSGVKVCVRGPPYTTAPPCNAWGEYPPSMIHEE